jgi:hypothetical protein
MIRGTMLVDIPPESATYPKVAFNNSCLLLLVAPKKHFLWLLMN